MKNIIRTLAVFALAISLAAPVFAATGSEGAKGQMQSTSAKATVKPVKATTKSNKKLKKSTETAHKTASKSAKSATPQSK